MNTRLACYILIAALGTVLGGCQTEALEFNWRTFRFERVTPRSQGPTAAPAASQPAPATAVAPTSAKATPEAGAESVSKSQPAFRTWSPETDKIKRGMLYRLHLIQDQLEPGLPPENCLVVRGVPVTKVAAVLAILCPGEGPVAGVNIQNMIYRDPAMWQEARSMAEALVPPPNGKRAEPEPWFTALLALYQADFPRRLTPPERIKIVQPLQTMVYEPRIKVEDRWAAAVLAAHLLVRYEPKDYIAAGELLGQAELLAGGSVHRTLIVRYHEIKCRLAQGDRQSAKALADRTLEEFRGLENSTCYQSIRLFRY